MRPNLVCDCVNRNFLLRYRPQIPKEILGCVGGFEIIFRLPRLVSLVLGDRSLSSAIVFVPIELEIGKSAFNDGRLIVRWI